MPFDTDRSRVQTFYEQEQAAQAAQQSRAEQLRWRPKAGHKGARQGNDIRILPPWTDKGPFAFFPFRVVFVHWLGDGETQFPVLCVKLTPGIEGQTCRVCPEVKRLYATRDPGDKEIASELRARKQYLYNIVDKNDPVLTAEDIEDMGGEDNTTRRAGQTKVQVFTCGQESIYMPIQDLIANHPIEHLEKGRWVTIYKSGTTKKDIDYSVTAAMEAEHFQPIGELQLYDLDNVYQPLPDEEILRLLGMGEEEEPQQVESGQKPRGQLPPKEPKQTKQPEPEPEPEPEPPRQEEEQPNCFKTDQHGEDNPMCVGGVLEGEEFTRCPFFDPCNQHWKANFAPKPQAGRRGRRASGNSGGTADSAAAVEAAMRQRLADLKKNDSKPPF